MAAFWHSTYGPAVRTVALFTAMTVLAIAFLYAVTVLFFGVVEHWNHIHTPPAPTVTQTTVRR